MKNEVSLDDLCKISLKNHKGLLVDIDDTLYSYKTAHEVALRECALALKKEIPLLYEKINENTFKDKYRHFRNIVTERLSPNGSCRSRLLAFQGLFESIETLSALEANKYALYFEECYWSILIDNIVRNEKVYDFIQKCLSSGYRICAISDMQAAFQIRKLIKMQYENIMLVTSEEVGVEKPSKLIFEYALKKLKLKSDEVLMLGDSFSKDIIGAENMGIKSYQVSLND